MKMKEEYQQTPSNVLITRFGTDQEDLVWHGTFVIRSL